MIHIVGGTYFEHCIEPRWSYVFGSGGRAAAALTRLNPAVFLNTYIGADRKQDLKNLAATFNFRLQKIETIPQTISFTYHHCLSNPLIQPNDYLTKKQASLLVNEKNVIRYGFLEGEAIVQAEKVVYDPQNEYASELFSANGSTAEKLAIIANINECQKLTNSSHDFFDAEILGKRLLELEKAEVVVVKQGSLGALVITPSEVQTIPVYQTNTVFSIGSGDIFTAVFANFWFLSKNPFEAAHLASLATALYCDTRTLPIPIDFEKRKNYQPVMQKNAFPGQPKQVYLAGPFFTMAERWMIEEARKHLIGEGFNVFSPLHDVGFGEARTVASADLAGLNKSDLVFALLDGLDSGTIFEIGYAKSLNKQVVVFAQNVSEKNLTMISGTGCEVVTDFASSIYRIVWAAMQM